MVNNKVNSNQPIVVASCCRASEAQSPRPRRVSVRTDGNRPGGKKDGLVPRTAVGRRRSNMEKIRHVKQGDLSGTGGRKTARQESERP